MSVCVYVCVLLGLVVRQLHEELERQWDHLVFVLVTHVCVRVCVRERESESRVRDRERRKRA